MKRMNKTGQQMTLGTIIAIVLGIAVLVFLIFGFSTGWNNLWDRVTQFGGGSANIDTIKQACALACTGKSSNAYCVQVRTVKFGREVTIGEDDVKSATGTCDEMVNVENFPGVNVEACLGLCN